MSPLQLARRWDCALLLALALVAPSDAAGKRAPAGPTPTRGGTIVIGHDQEPDCLNLLLGCGNLFATSITAGVAFPGAFRARPDSSYEPVLVDKVKVEEQPTFTLTYHIKAEAVWSDGTPVSADDFIFTHEAIMNPANDITTREGHDRIVKVTRLGAKRVRVEMSGPYAPWRTLFGVVYPKHALAGLDFNQVFLDDLDDPRTGEPIGSGPFLLTGRVPGQSLTLSRNPRWWGPQPKHSAIAKPYLDTVEFRFMAPADLFAAIRAGQIDMMAPQPSLLIGDLAGDPDLVVDVAPNRNLEHLDFQTLGATMPLLQQAWFRQAVAYSLDREQVATELYDAMSPGFRATHSLFYSAAQPEYEPSFARYVYDPAKVASIMTANGCELGTDGIWTCGGVRASLRYATTANNPLRGQAQLLFQQQAKEAGIELVVDNSPAPVLFGVRLPTRAFEAVMFTWVKAADVGGDNGVYGCGGDLNYMDYCSPAVTDLLAAADSELDPVARAALVNQANALIAEDAPTLPLFNRPAFLVYRVNVQGAVNNPTNQGMVWNIEDWWLADD